MTPPSIVGPFTRPPVVEELVPAPSIRELDACIRDRPAPFILETTGPGGGMGAWHFLGSDPVGELRMQGRDFLLARGPDETRGVGDPWTVLEGWWESWRSPEARPRDSHDATPPIPFLGGAVGYLGYELGEALESFAARANPEPELPDLHLHLYDKVIAVQRSSARVFCIHRQPSGRPPGPWTPAPAEVASGARDRRASLPGLREIDRSLSDESYLQAVTNIRNAIGRGDVYEANLTRRHVFEGGPGPWTLHERLRVRQPVPYGAILPWQPVSVVSASPERFLTRRGAAVETRPIKGTAPRGRSSEEDTRIGKALLADEKERAELAMIIDLERNDLGRVCTPGSIRVVEEAALERYATVIHTVGTVRGELPPEVSPIALLRATFPGGSITGAPKIAAMHHIRDLEPVPRKVYTGAIGWISPTGDLDLSVAIRTVFQAAGRTYFSVGGAVTWDSVPAHELRELEAKGRAIMRALRGE